MGTQSTWGSATWDNTTTPFQKLQSDLITSTSINMADDNDAQHEHTFDSAVRRRYLFIFGRHIWLGTVLAPHGPRRPHRFVGPPFELQLTMTTGCRRIDDFSHAVLGTSQERFRRDQEPPMQDRRNVHLQDGQARSR